MTDEAASVPVAGSLSAKVIRACRVHKECPLECAERKVVDLGEIANFDNRPTSQPSLVERIKEVFRG